MAQQATQAPPPAHCLSPDGHVQVPPAVGQTWPFEQSLLVQQLEEDMHAPLHSLVPLGHAQLPPGPEQTSPPVQSLELQQLDDEMQVPLHSFVPPGHAQVPPGDGQTSPPEQSLFRQQLAVAIHVPLQSFVPDAQRQEPAWQVRPLGQTWPHAPQLLISEFKSVHLPVQSVPDAQPQWPLMQLSPPAVLHLMLQPPQLLLSVCAFTQAPAQSVPPLGQTQAYVSGAVVKRHWSGEEQEVPHAPQLGDAVSNVSQPSTAKPLQLPEPGKQEVMLQLESQVPLELLQHTVQLHQTLGEAALQVPQTFPMHATLVLPPPDTHEVAGQSLKTLQLGAPGGATNAPHPPFGSCGRLSKDDLAESSATSPQPSSAEELPKTAIEKISLNCFWMGIGGP